MKGRSVCDRSGGNFGVCGPWDLELSLHPRRHGNDGKDGKPAVEGRFQTKYRIKYGETEASRIIAHGCFGSTIGVLDIFRNLVKRPGLLSSITNCSAKMGSGASPLLLTKLQKDLRMNLGFSEITSPSGTKVFLAALPPTVSFSIAYDREIQNVRINGEGRYVGQRPTKKVNELIPSKTLQSALVITNANNYYWHSDDFLMIDGEFIRRNDGLGSDYVRVPCFMFAQMGKDFAIKQILTAQDLSGIRLGLYGLPLLFDYKDQVAEMIDAYRFDVRILFDIYTSEHGERSVDPGYIKHLPAFDRFPFNWGKCSKEKMKTFFASHRPYPESLIPATALGIDDKGQILVLACNGRLAGQLGLSVGEIALIFLKRGVRNAILLGTGGDSFMYYRGVQKTEMELRAVPAYLVFQDGV